MEKPEPVVIKNGIVTEDGVMYYYVNDKKTYVGLIKIADDYYYVNGSCIVVTGKYYVSRTNGLMEKGWYEFAEDGKMILPEKEETTPESSDVSENNNETSEEITVPVETPEDEVTPNPDENPEDEVTPDPDEIPEDGSEEPIGEEEPGEDVSDNN